MSDRFESLESGEVVSILHEAQVLNGHRTFRSGELNETIKGLVEQAIAGWSAEKNDWFTDRGIDCEALRFGSKGWQKGRIRLSLEFCPDEPDLPAANAINTSIPTAKTAAMTESGSAPTHSSPVTTAAAQHDEVLSLHQDPLPITATHAASTPDPLPITATNTPDSLTNIAVPVAGIAATGAVAAVATMFSPAIASLKLQSPDLHVARESVNEPVSNVLSSVVNESPAIPHFDDAFLEPEHHHVDSISPNSGGLDELAFVFDESDNDRGRMIPNGMMEIDLADGLDFSEHDLLSFEANGMTDLDGFGSFQDIDKPENSGALIDEVWNEMNQGSWPRVN
jgi:KGK domain